MTTLKGGLWRWDGYVQPLGVQNSYSERLQQITKLRNLQDELPTKEKEEVTIVNEINKNELELKKFFETTREIESKISLLNNELNDTKLSISSLDSKINSSTILLKEHQNILDTSQKELEDFVDQLSTKQFTAIETFFATMPKLSHSVKVTNPITKTESTVVLEGLAAFFS